MFKKENALGEGRKTGSQNKVSQKIRESFSLLLESNLDQLDKDFKEIDNPKDRIKLFY